MRKRHGPRAPQAEHLVDTLVVGRLGLGEVVALQTRTGVMVGMRLHTDLFLEPSLENGIVQIDLVFPLQLNDPRPSIFLSRSTIGRRNCS